ncbi:Proline iminopeptidase [Acidisarcina polymorpha]|uniref:Proline iminopeptidase n=1 Tax=Acidisarcina polymorpha TaxID=2211140 RepID=A0A2Z5FWK9_9BACT|nr:alpha/beta hydrolase [Acidisarcina polymorpha]AXC11221.1 Proline iminopeptidase [Acidisarcina polymorpha]
MRTSIGDISLWFDTDGVGLVVDGKAMLERRTIVILHGGPGFDHSTLKPEYEVLAQVAQLVFIDQRGHGRSDLSEKQFWNLDRWADDVAAFCHTLDIKEPILLGQSFGGFVALAAAIRHPSLFRGVITLGSVAHVEREAAIARFGELGGPPAAAAFADVLARPEDETAFTKFTQLCFPLYSRQGFNPVKMARSIINRELINHFFGPGGEYGNFDLRAGLATTHTPTLLLHGKLDPILPIEFARATAAAFPPGVAELVAYDDCAHSVAADRWEDAHSRMVEFIRRLD